MISLLIVRATPARVVAPISVWALDERGARASGETPAAKARSKPRSAGRFGRPGSSPAALGTDAAALVLSG